MKKLVNKYSKFMQVILFAGIFLLIWALDSRRLESPLLNDVVIFYTVITFFTVWFNYFILSTIIFKIKIPFKWPLFIIVIVLLYFCSLYTLTTPLKFMHFRYPDHQKIKFLYEGLYITSYKRLLSLRGSSFLAEQLYFFLFLFFAGSMVFRYIESMKKVTDLELKNANQQLDLLKSQIHPEFLLNTLNNLQQLTKENGKAGDVIGKLSDLMGFTLYQSKTELIPLKVELKYLEDYIELEKIRHHDHVEIDYDFSTIDNEETQLAPLLFINFIENAFKHGVNKTRGKSWVKIKLVQEANFIRFEVTNSKPKLQRTTRQSGGKGLDNITRRLMLLYPDKHQLNIENVEELYSVQLEINLA
ncbi:histidine kinase [Litoribacter alkaliphilus]|uniref:Histidine kinase n=1 Tax=Litoribacter ruber TaxID=702568 RepID=A0AAP2CFG3_9BACT|nr:histidine kinase [Litoribacter alkaliphilus]MBS9523593.1 histidine kinase [Litoribacter alkaliphilus]